MPLPSPATLAQALGALRIAHHIPGRIRLAMDQDAPVGGLAAALRDAQALQRAVAGLAGIASVRLNPLARTCVIAYDAAAIPPAAWEDLVAGRDAPAARSLRTALAARLAEVAGA